MLLSEQLKAHSWKATSIKPGDWVIYIGAVVEGPILADVLRPEFDLVVRPGDAFRVKEIDEFSCQVYHPRLKSETDAIILELYEIEFLKEGTFPLPE